MATWMVRSSTSSIVDCECYQSRESAERSVRLQIPGATLVEGLHGETLVYTDQEHANRDSDGQRPDLILARIDTVDGDTVEGT